MHEHLIDVLNRRFVNYHFNAFTGPGHDAEAATFLRDAQGLRMLGGARYGAFVTPEGKAVATFGFKRDEFVAAVRRAYEHAPEHMLLSVEEQDIFAAAQDETNAAAQLRAADLEASLLRYEDARARLKRMLASELEAGAKAQAHYRLGHLAAIDLDGKKPAVCRAAFAQVTPAPKELADDIAADLVWLDVELAKRPGFYTGWIFRAGADVAGHAKALEAAIASAPTGNRIGQLHFLLGLAKQHLGDAAGANEVWSTQVRKWPHDRWAMLGRIHHTGYRFSPTKGGRTGAAGGVVGLGDLKKDKARARALLEVLERGGGTIAGGNSEAMRAMLIAQLKRILAEDDKPEPAAPDEGDAPDAPGNSDEK